jgi:pimeloyl-ACP methyl ester carboxylesterase
MRVRFLELAGVRTRILYEGDPANYPILLIHGLGSTADTWLRNIDRLAEDYFVVAPDLFNHGFSDPVDLAGQPPHPTHLAELAGLADAFGFERFCACGSSYGALLAALLYFERPQQVEKLVIVGSGSCFNTEAEQVLTLQAAKKNALSAIGNPTLETTRKRTQATLYDPASVPEDMLLIRLTAYAQPHMRKKYEEVVAGMLNLEAARPYRIYERLEKIDVETLIVWGREDPRGRHERAVEAVARMPRATLLTYERCGHLPFLEYPDRWNGDIRKFVQHTGESPPS